MFPYFNFIMFLHIHSTQTASLVSGFKGVESGFPLDIPINELYNTRENVQIEQVHMNAFDGRYKTSANFLGFVRIKTVLDQRFAIIIIIIIIIIYYYYYILFLLL